MFRYMAGEFNKTIYLDSTDIVKKLLKILSFLHGKRSIAFQTRKFNKDVDSFFFASKKEKNHYVNFVRSEFCIRFVSIYFLVFFIFLFFWVVDDTLPTWNRFTEDSFGIITTKKEKERERYVAIPRDVCNIYLSCLFFCFFF